MISLGSHLAANKVVVKWRVIEVFYIPEKFSVLGGGLYGKEFKADNETVGLGSFSLS